jgi:peptidoglycan/LPS O-acetylase OafA/YrhL
MGLSMTSPLFAILAFVVWWLVANFGKNFSTFYRNEAAAIAEPSRFGYLDGARGYLALGVFLSHAATSYYWYKTGAWDWPPSVLYIMIGRIPVAMFFMITGFLFWNKAIRSPASLSWRRLLSSRFYRLAPLYLFAMLFVFILVGLRTHWHLQVGLGQLAISVIRWLGIGLLGRPAINGFDGSRLIEPILWTLRYEWFFYLTLPLIARFNKLRYFPVFVLGTLIITSMHINIEEARNLDVVWNFVYGMAAACLISVVPASKFFASKLGAVIAISGLVATGVFGFIQYGFQQSMLLFPLFLCIVYGNSLFGLISTGQAKILSDISYSIYLLHCIVLYGLLFFVNSMTPVVDLTPLAYWGLMLAAAAVTIAASLVTYRWIEYPFLPGARATSARDQKRRKASLGEAGPAKGLLPMRVIPGVQADPAPLIERAS